MRSGIGKGDAGKRAGHHAPIELLEAMGQYNDELVNAGVMVWGEPSTTHLRTFS